MASSSGINSASEQEQKEKRPSLLRRLSNTLTTKQTKQESKEQSSVTSNSFSIASNTINSQSASGIPLMGVSLRWFVYFVRTEEKVKNVMHKKGRGAIMDDLLSVIKDMTSEVDESFAEMLLRTQPEMNLTKPIADVFISYARIYPVHHMMDAFESILPDDEYDDNAEHEFGDSEDTYIWLDSLAINQRVKSEFDPNFFIKTLKQGIETISNVAVVLTPWDNPGNLTRAWCIWELYSAMESKGVNIQVLIPFEEQQPFRDALLKDPQQLLARIAKIDIEKAQAWSAKDKDMILDAARKAEGGIQGVRESVIQPLRNWMTNEALKLVNEIEKYIKDEEGYEYINEDLSKALSCAGTLFKEQNKLDEAEKMFRRAIEVDEKEFGGDHPDVASDLNSLAVLLQGQQRFDEAEPLFRRALAIREKYYGSDDPNVALTLNGLGNLKYNQGNFEEAEALLRKALEIDERILGSNHPDVGINLNSLANMLADKGDYEEAGSLYKRALEIREKEFGTDHPLVAANLSNLALLLRDQGKFKDAEPIFKRALAIDENAYGSVHPDVAVDLKNLATLLSHDQDRFDEAMSYYKRSLEIFDKLFGKDDPAYVATQEAFDKLLEKIKEYKE